MQGIIKKLVSNKGFGFIQADNGDEFFVHRTEMAQGVDFDSLKEGERVEFDEGESKKGKGPRAINVERA